MSNDAQWYRLKGYYKNSPKYPITTTVLIRKSFNWSDEKITAHLQPEITEFQAKWNFDYVEWERERL